MLGVFFVVFCVTCNQIYYYSTYERPTPRWHVVLGRLLRLPGRTTTTHHTTPRTTPHPISS